MEAKNVVGAQTKELKKFKYIDALRGYAIIAVVLNHSSQFVAPENPILKLVMSAGGLGVPLFYIASAITLCASWDFRGDHESNPHRNFFIRRFFRIAPMFYLAIVFYLIFYGFQPRYWAPSGIEWWHVLLTTFFLHGIHPEAINSVVPGGWSIAVEMCFYVFLPSLMFYLNTLKRLVIFIWFSICLYIVQKNLLLVFLAPLFSIESQHIVYHFVNFNFFSQLPVFGLGLLVYSLLKNPGNFNWRTASLIFLVLFFVLLFLRWFGLIGNYLFSAYFLALLALFLALWPKQFLVNGMAITTGRISFSMYLVHIAVLEFCTLFGFSAIADGKDIVSLLHFILVFFLTAVLSYVFYMFVEKPGIDAGRRLIARYEGA